LDQSSDISLGLNRSTPPPPSPSRTKWTRRVPHPVLIGHAVSRSTVNTSHVINHLSFGTDYPGLKNQLDGETKTLEEASPASH
jgi:hypothetical protein